MANSQQDTQRFMQNLQKEVDGEALYSVLAQKETRHQMQTVYLKLAESERRHAQFWRKKLEGVNVNIPEFQPTWQTRTLIWLAQRFGAQFVLPTVTSREKADSGSYATQPETEAASMSAEEQSHARLLSATNSGGGVSGNSVAETG